MSKRELNRIDVLARLDGRRLMTLTAADLMRVTPRQHLTTFMTKLSHCDLVPIPDAKARAAQVGFRQHVQHGALPPQLRQ